MPLRKFSVIKVSEVKLTCDSYTTLYTKTAIRKRMRRLNETLNHTRILKSIKLKLKNAPIFCKQLF